jgi:hypothetical protein
MPVRGKLIRHAVIVTILGVAGVLLAAGPASAGGSWFDPVADRSEAGERVTLVGYTSGLGSLGTVDDGPFYGYLRAARAVAPTGPNPSAMAPMQIGPSDLPLGPLTIATTGQGGYLTYRASITFVLPPTIRPGTYDFIYCNAGCTSGFGDLVGGVVYVGVDPEHSVSREWALDDPEVANLDDDSRLSGPGYDLSAAEVRAGGPIPNTLPRPEPAPVAAVATRPAPRAQPAGDDGPVAWLVLGLAGLAFVTVAVTVRRLRHRRELRQVSAGGGGTDADGDAVDRGVAGDDVDEGAGREDVRVDAGMAVGHGEPGAGQVVAPSVRE